MTQINELRELIKKLRRSVAVREYFEGIAECCTLSPYQKERLKEERNNYERYSDEIESILISLENRENNQ